MEQEFDQEQFDEMDQQQVFALIEKHVAALERGRVNSRW